MTHLATFEELHEFVRRVLCTRSSADPLAPLLDAALSRAGQPCGIEYTLLASRAIRLSAIWEARKDRVLFYDYDLTRFCVLPVRGPDPASIPLRVRQRVPLLSVWGGR